MNRANNAAIVSLLAILFFTLHFADDIYRGFEEGDLFDYIGILIVAVWLHATITSSDRPIGLGIMLLFSLGAAAVPALHMTGPGMAGGRIHGSSGAFFWVWMLIALGATGLVSAALSAQALWRLRRAAQR